jgi:hypothetical protein
LIEGIERLPLDLCLLAELPRGVEAGLHYFEHLSTTQGKSFMNFNAIVIKRNLIH